MTKTRVLFVCLGNICRSPVAEAIFNHKIGGSKIDALVEADSCGTANYHIGHTPDPRTISNAKKNGVTINHRGRQLSQGDLEHFDFIFAMDESNYRNILRLDLQHRYEHKINLMRTFDPFGTGDVPDPYYGTEQNFQEVFDILDRTLDNFVGFLEEKLLGNTKA